MMVQEQTAEKHGGRWLRWRAGTTAALVALVPFACFFLLAEIPHPELRRELFLHALPCLALALALAALAGYYTAAWTVRLEAEAEDAHDLAKYREMERNEAQGELTRRLQQERDLVQEKMQFEFQLSEYEKYAALAQLALGAAHEINNPLLGIQSHLELELRAAREEDGEEIEQCIAGAKRISSTIRSLINYARPGPLLLSKINLDRLVAEAVGFLQHQPLFRSITLEMQIQPDLPPLTADSNQLSQILMNLLLNAAEATSEGGHITVQAQKLRTSESVELVVRDTGSGIPADILPHVFEPFFTTKRGKGTGLGLSISQSYVRSHGGEMKIDSTPEQGTTVRIVLPLQQSGRAVPEDEEVVV